MAEVDRVPAALSERLVTLRREFHRQPELAFEERKTAARIIAELESLGLEYSYEGAGSGVVGRLDGDPGHRRDGSALRLRGDRRVQRRGSRRDARLWPRRAHGNGPGSGPSAQR